MGRDPELRHSTLPSRCRQNISMRATKIEEKDGGKYWVQPTASGTSARMVRLSVVFGNTREERRNKQVFYKVERESAIWRNGKIGRINSKFFDCKFHVNPGETSMQLLEAIRQHVPFDERLYLKKVYAKDVLHLIIFIGKPLEATNQTSGTPQSSEILQAVLGQDIRSSFRKYLEIRQV